MSTFTFRDLIGEDPRWPMGAPDQPNAPLPRNEPVTTRIEGPWGIPYIEGLEDPNASTGLLNPSPNPAYEVPDVGWSMPPGDYAGEYRTLGPVQQFGHEVSGGLTGDQAIGRTMRFPVNVPDRYDANGVNVGDYRDLLAGALAANNLPTFSDTAVIEDLVLWPGDAGFGGWGT